MARKSRKTNNLERAVRCNRTVNRLYLPRVYGARAAFGYNVADANGGQLADAAKAYGLRKVRLRYLVASQILTCGGRSGRDVVIFFHRQMLHDHVQRAPVMRFK